MQKSSGHWKNAKQAPEPPPHLCCGTTSLSGYCQAEHCDQALGTVSGQLQLPCSETTAPLGPGAGEGGEAHGLQGAEGSADTGPRLGSTKPISLDPRDSPAPTTPLVARAVAMSSLFPLENHFVVALYDYKAMNDRDLQMLKGEKLQILSE